MQREMINYAETRKDTDAASRGSTEGVDRSGGGRGGVIGGEEDANRPGHPVKLLTRVEPFTGERFSGLRQMKSRRFYAESLLLT